MSGGVSAYQLMCACYVHGSPTLPVLFALQLNSMVVCVYPGALCWHMFEPKGSSALQPAYTSPHECCLCFIMCLPHHGAHQCVQVNEDPVTNVKVNGDLLMHCVYQPCTTWRDRIQSFMHLAHVLGRCTNHHHHQYWFFQWILLSVWLLFIVIIWVCLFAGIGN